jgi:predicted nucleic acid-binding Zn ribbon protein
LYGFCFGGNIMPFYTFICENEECEHKQSTLVKMGTKEVECEECGETAHYSFINSTRFASTGLPNGHITNRPSFRPNDDK